MTGPTTAAESSSTGSVTADKKKGKGGGGGEPENEANDDRGQARGRPEGEVQGTVAGRTAGCPTFTFQVAGVGISANGVTEFEGTSCATLQNGDAVKVEGQPLGNGTILAREVKKVTGASPAVAEHAAGISVRLVDSSGGIAGEVVTGSNGQFEFRNTAPGAYRLTAQLPGSATSCAPALASDIELAARRNRVRGTLDVAGSLTCAHLSLTKLEARNGS